MLSTLSLGPSTVPTSTSPSDSPSDIPSLEPTSSPTNRNHFSFISLNKPKSTKINHVHILSKLLENLPLHYPQQFPPKYHQHPHPFHQTPDVTLFCEMLLESSSYRDWCRSRRPMFIICFSNLLLFEVQQKLTVNIPLLIQCARHQLVRLRIRTLLPRHVTT